MRMTLSGGPCLSFHSKHINKKNVPISIRVFSPLPSWLPNLYVGLGYIKEEVSIKKMRLIKSYFEKCDQSSYFFKSIVSRNMFVKVLIPIFILCFILCTLISLFVFSLKKIRIMYFITNKK